MNEFLLNAFLTRYCYLSELMPRDTRHDAYGELCDIFCLEYDETLSRYRFALLNPQFYEMRDKNGFERFCRILEFGALSDQPVQLDETQTRILSAKREALGALHKIMPGGRLLSVNTDSALYTAAVRGDLFAMTARAYMEYHGIGMPADPEAARRRIAAAARWNDLFANLMGLVYDPQNASAYQKRLYTVKFGAGRAVAQEVFAYRKLSCPMERDSVAALLDKAFAMQIVKPDCYDRSFGKIAFCPLVSVQDKEKLLLSCKEVPAGLTGLPFDAKMTGAHFDPSVLCEAQPSRAAERDRVLCNLGVLAKPLLLQCADGYSGKMYENLLRLGFADAPLYTVDGASLDARDFVRGQEHILLRALSATKSALAVVLVTNAEQLSPQIAKELSDILHPKARKSFALSAPAISFDLSGVRFILIAGGRTAVAQSLHADCDTVQIAPCTDAEKSELLSQCFADCKRRFAVPDMQLEDACAEHLRQYDLPKAAEILEGAVGLSLYRKKDVITLTVAKEIAKEKRISSQKRGFGYTGGDYAEN